MDLEAVSELFIADMSAFLAGLDEGIAKAAEFAGACGAAEERVTRMAETADAAAGLVAAAMSKATGSVGELAVAMKALDDKHVTVTADVSGMAAVAAEAGVLQRELADISGDLIMQTELLRGMDAALGVVRRDVADASADLMMQTGLLREIRDLLAESAMAAGVYNVTIRDAAARTAAAGAAGANGMRIWGTGIRLTGAAIHWLVAGTMEFLAVALPATAAGVAWAAVWLQGTANVVEHMNAVYTATEATANVFHTTAGQVVGLGDALQKAQDAANPDVYQALGGAIMLVRENAGGLATVGLQVGRIFDTFLAKLVYDFSAAGGSASMLHGLLAGMIPDLVQFGQVFGNIGHALFAFAAQMPGLARVLLAVLDGFTFLVKGVVDFTNSVRPLGFDLLTVAMGMEEFARWGGLLVGLMGRMGFATTALEGNFASVGGFFARFGSVALNLVRAPLLLASTAIAGVGNLLSRLPGVAGRAGAAIEVFGTEAGLAGAAMTTFGAVAVIAASVGLGILIDKLVTAKSQWQAFADAQQAAVSRASNLDVIGVIASRMAYLSSAAATAAAATAHFDGITMKATVGSHSWNEALAANQAELVSLGSQLGKVTGGAAYLAKTYGTSMTGAMAVADLAGVKLASGITGQGQAAAIARNKIADLMAGYQAMGQSASMVGHDVTMVGIASALAATKVTQLNQASDQFVAGVTGGTSALGGLAESIANIGKVTITSASALKGYNAASGLTFSQSAAQMRNFGQVGSQVWQNFDSALTGSGQQLADWMRTAGAMGAVSAPQMAQGMRDVVAQFVPFTRDSATARQTLLGFAQAQGLNVTSFGELLKSLKDSGAGEQDLQRLTEQITGKMADMSAVAQALGSSIGADLVGALNSARIAGSGLERAATGMAQAWGQAHQVNTQVIAGYTQTFNALLSVDHNTQSAKAAADAYAQSLGLTKGQIAELDGNLSALAPRLSGIAGAVQGVTRSMADARAAAQRLQAAIDAMHGKTIPIMIDIAQSGGGIHLPGGGGTRVTPGMAAGGTARRGWSWVGEEGPELMYMRGGEHVVPATQSRDLAALASLARNARGYAGGTASARQKAAASLLHSEISQLRGFIGSDTTVNSLAHDVSRIAIMLARIRSEEAHGTITAAEAGTLRAEADQLRGRARQHERAIEHSKAGQLARQMAGLARDTSAKDVRSGVRALLSEVRADFRAGDITGREETRLVRFLDHDNKRLQHLAGERGKLLARIKAADQYASAVQSTALQSASLSGIISAAGGGPVSSSYLLASMRIDLQAIRRFDSDIKRLEKLGLDRALLNQVIQMGPVQGDQVAQALINGPLSNIKSLNATESKVQAASKGLGRDAANMMFDTGRDAGHGFLKGLEDEQKSIERLMRKMARDMVRTLRRELRTHSPSEVTREIAHDLMDGFPAGIADRVPSVDSALRAAAGHVSSALGSAAGTGGGGAMRLELTIPVTVKLPNGKVLFKEVQTQSARVDRRNGTNRLSVTSGRG